MLRITAFGVGAVDYLLRGSGCTEHAHAQTAGEKATLDGAGYMLAAAEKEPAGVWYGTGLQELLGIEVGTTATEDQVRAVLGRLEHPTAIDEDGDALALGSKPRTFKSRDQRIAAALEAEPDATEERKQEIRNQVRADQRKAVAYYDLTFSPVKSLSVYWAALLVMGRTEEAANVVAAHRKGVAAAMAYIEREASYVRTGYHGKTASGRSVGAYEEANGMAWIRWDHSTNRDRQPQLHAHVTVVNRATTSGDGMVRSLDGKGFRPIKQAADAIYRRTYVEELERTNKVVFALRSDGKAREIMGFAASLLAKASTRAREIEAHLAKQVTQFEQAYGRAPSPAERKSMHHAAWRETRAGKDYQTGPQQQIAEWTAPLHGELSSAVSQAEKAAADVQRYGHPDQRDYASRTREQLLQDAVRTLQTKYSQWEVGNLVDFIADELPRTPTVTETAEDLAAAVLRNGAQFGVHLLTAPDPGPVPEALQRADGKSRFRPHNQEWWTTTDQLSVENAIVTRARETGAPSMAGPLLELARIEAERAGLSPDQRDAVLAILSSGRHGDVLIGPAGSGKSRTVSTLANLWEANVGGRVFGLATSQAATNVLAEDGLTALNTTVFRQQFAPESGAPSDRIQPGDLVVIDEAGMSSTEELRTISELVAAGGGKLLFVGDHEQLAAIEAGGMLELLVRDAGAHVLTELHRFRHQWEKDASIRLRAGDVEVLAEYARRGRIRGGTEQDMIAAAVRGYLADTLAGHVSLLVVRDNDTAAGLSTSIRAELIAAGKVSHEVIGETRDGNFIGVGDMIQARRNDRKLLVDGNGMVTNRELYRVLGREERTGDLLVQNKHGAVAHLPQWYLRADVTLAYAVTAHSSQGLSVWWTHDLVDQHTNRAGAYVPGTRGREGNTFYVACQVEPDHHAPERVDRDALDMLASILTRHEEGVSAAELARRAGIEEGRSLSWVGTQWDLLTAEFGRDRYTDALTHLLGAQQMDTVAAEPGYDRLMAAVRGVELRGHNPAAVLGDAMRRGSMVGANSVSDVLRSRVERLVSAGRTPERVVDAHDWTTLADGFDGPVGAYVDVLAWAATGRQIELGERIAADPPAWALEAEALGAVPSDPRQRDEWVHRAGVVAAYRDLHSIPETQLSIGAAPHKNRAFHHALWHQAHAALGHPTDALDFAIAADEELRQMREQWRREQTWAPAFVDEQLAAAREQAEDYRRDTIIWRAGLDALAAGSPERDQAERDVAAAERLHAVSAARVAALEEVDAVRQAWFAASAPVRERAEHAGDELERRGLDRDLLTPRGEQLGLFDIDEQRGRKKAGAAAQEVPEAAPAVAPRVEHAYQQHRDAEAEQAVRDEREPALFAATPDAAAVAAEQPLHVLEPVATSTDRTDHAAAVEDVSADVAAPVGEEQIGTTRSGDDEAELTVGAAARQARILWEMRADLDARTAEAARTQPAPTSEPGVEDELGVGAPMPGEQQEHGLDTAAERSGRGQSVGS